MEIDNAVDCREYIEHHLSTHVDGELAPDERRAAEQHVAGCDRCRAELNAEHALKSFMRKIGHQKTPATVAEGIHQALDGAMREATAGDHRYRRSARRGRSGPRGPWIWIPTAIAAAIAIAIALSRNSFSPSGSVPSFDQATGKLAAFETDFTPNVPSDSVSALQRAYDVAQMPSGIWNFTRSGFKLVGGRIDEAANGRRVTYTLYRGPSSELILCMRFRGAVDMAIPKDALMQMAGHSFYRYRGMSLCVTVGPNQRFTCILAAPIPVERFERIVASAAIDHHS
jgi:anti-sigma factor RsiW